MFETYRMLGRERRTSVVIVAVIVAAFAFGAAVARAEVWPDGRSGAQLTTQPPAPDLVERWVASHKTHALAPDNRIRVRPTETSNQVVPPDLIERWVANHKKQVLAPDDRIGVRPTETSNQVAPPDLIERWVASHGRQVGQAPQPASNSHTGEAFDWRAAIVGATTTAALVLALGIGIGITRRSKVHSAAA
jgi:hypothetical protein